MTLDDVYGPDLDEFPLEQQERREAAPLLDWGDAEVRLSRLAAGMPEPGGESRAG